MNWIDTRKQSPPDNSRLGGEIYIVTITCYTWKEPKTMIMRWECTTIRGKEVKRWKWNNSIKIDGWEVTHWMELPCPATN
jgi:hypothetical protein